MSEKILYVKQNTPASEIQFNTISDAISSLDNSKDTIFIKISPGLYDEQVFLERDNVILEGLGDSPEDTIITHSLGAFDIMPDGSKRGTFRSYTMFAGGNGIELKNLTIQNTSGEPKQAGQSIALYAEGDNFKVSNCRLISRQDTLFTGPLPPKEIQPGGFIGPRQYAERIDGKQYYDNCFICGDVDFIFGSATAFFNNCTIKSVVHDREKLASLNTASDSDDDAFKPVVQGYVTAASTPEGQEKGYTFTDCDFTCDDELPDHCVYLGRPWRDYAKTVFINCKIGRHIHPDGFHDWNKENARNNVFYRTVNCTISSGSDNGKPFIPGAPFAKNVSTTEEL